MSNLDAAFKILEDQLADDAQLINKLKTEVQQVSLIDGGSADDANLWCALWLERTQERGAKVNELRRANN